MDTMCSMFTELQYPYSVCLSLCINVFMVCGTVQKNIQSLILLCVITDTAVTQWRMDDGADWFQNSSSYETSNGTPHASILIAQ